MRTIRKSDVIFNLDTKHVYVQDFNAKFFTVNEKDYFIEYSSADVVTTEKEGEIIYSLNLDWKRLRNVGKGVLIFKCINNIPDEDFPDGSYNSEYKITTDYFIDTFEVEPEEHESIVELIEEETENRISGDTFLSGAIDAVDAKVDAKQDILISGTNIKTINNESILGEGNIDIESTRYTAGSGIDISDDVISVTGKVDSDEYLAFTVDTKNHMNTEIADRTAADGVLSAAVDTLDAKVENYKQATNTAVTALGNALQAEVAARTANDADLSARIDTKADKATTYTKTEVDAALGLKVNVADVVTAITPSNSGSTDPVATCVVAENEKVVASALTDIDARKLDASAYTPTDLSNYYTKSETSGKTEIQTALAGKANTATTYTKTEVDTALAAKANTATTYTKIDVDTALGLKQNTLVSGTNIKTINNESILGSGNIDIQGGGSNVISLTQAEYDALETIDPDALYVISDAAEVDMSNYYTKAQTNTIVGGKQDTLVSGTNIKKINNESILGEGNIDIQGGSDYTAGEGIDITNDVISVTGKVDTSYVENVEKTVARAMNDLHDSISGKADASAVTEEITSAVSGKADASRLGGLSLVKLTQAQYDALAIKDPNTLYIIVEPAFDGKVLLTYSDGTSYSAACDGDTTLRMEETRPDDYDYSTITDAIIGECVTSIGSSAFGNCEGLTSIEIPNTVTSIDPFAFNDCISLTSVTIPNSVTSIGDYAFDDCSGLISVTIGSGVTSIGDAAFMGCSGLTSIEIPNSVTSIGDAAFRSCSGLTSIVIPSGVTSIGESAFESCRSLESITIEATVPPMLDTNVFDDTNDCPINVPSESVEDYKMQWPDYQSRIQAIS